MVKKLLSEMPGWVADQIDLADYVGYLQAPVGTWEGKTYRISIDGDCHNFNYRTDYFENEELAKAWKDEGHEGNWEVPTTWQKVTEVSKFLKRKETCWFPCLWIFRCSKRLGWICFLLFRKYCYCLCKTS